MHIIIIAHIFNFLNSFRDSIFTIQSLKEKAVVTSQLRLTQK